MHTDLRLSTLIASTFAVCSVIPLNDYTVPAVFTLLVACCLSTLAIIVKHKLVTGLGG